MSRSTRWTDLNPVSAKQYAARFSALTAAGADVHGEASFVSSLLCPPRRVLDAGCGTGRLAIRLDELGYECVGIDADLEMLEIAVPAGTTRWVHGDICDRATWRPIGMQTSGPLPEWLDGGADVVVLAGNVIPLLAPHTLGACLQVLAATLTSGGLLVAGFGLDSAHLPPGCPPTPLAEFEVAAGAAGLRLVSRHASWAGQGWDDGSSGYAVSVLST